MKLSQRIDFRALERIASPDFAGGRIGTIVNKLVPYIFAVAGILLLLYLIYGGYKYMLSRGDPKTIESAKSTITTALIGFVIIFVAFWIVQIVGRVLGIIFPPFG